ncbi:MAG: ACP phosphodiesterase [Cyclobacteriaceae bacterium]|nr:ACP phosphodiesterase [Cyclobacteriaceae bacterium]
MNFLAHIYLSGESSGVKIGNFLGDFVKGRDSEKFPLEIETGILLHREIDEFTDHHEIVLESKKRLRPVFGHYAPVIVDVFYDHFLASLWPRYATSGLMDFTLDFYHMARENRLLMPEKARFVLGYMARDNWLYNYQFLTGIDKALSGMARRTKFESGMENAAASLARDYEPYKEEFISFFPELMAFATDFLSSHPRKVL